jgi:hypothetical protein
VIKIAPFVPQKVYTRVYALKKLEPLTPHHTTTTNKTATQATQSTINTTSHTTHHDTTSHTTHDQQSKAQPTKPDPPRNKTKLILSPSYLPYSSVQTFLFIVYLFICLASYMG